ncbi:DUF3304 domain-containing protein [Providencia rettgeri]
MNIKQNILRISQCLIQYKKRLLGLLLVAFLGWASWFTWLIIWGPPQGGVILVINTQIDRPIIGFSVNGVAGGNVSAYNPNNIYGGIQGGTACCGIIKGDMAHVVWTLSVTGDQYDAGLRKETREATLPLPKRKRGDRFLHVFFLPNDQVRLWWGEDLGTPWKRGMTTEELVAALEQ